MRTNPQGMVCKSCPPLTTHAVGICPVPVNRSWGVCLDLLSDTWLPWCPRSFSLTESVGFLPNIRSLLSLTMPAAAQQKLCWPRNSESAAKPPTPAFELPPHSPRSYIEQPAALGPDFGHY
jgi:hypothetical protein